MPRTMTALTIAALTAIGISSCSAAPRPHITASQATRERAAQAARALGVNGSSDATQNAVTVLRLGILATPSDTAGLTAIGLGYIAAKLSPSGAQLAVTAFTTPAAEATALTAGTIDAAYTTPAAARAAWVSTHSGIRIIAGADQSRGGVTAIILTVRTNYLSAHYPEITGLLQGHIEAVALLTTSPTTAIIAARREYAALGSATLGRPEISAFSQYSATCNPGRITTRGLFDLAPVNTLLRASGMSAA
jgi:hypothetical protein